MEAYDIRTWVKTMGLKRGGVVKNGPLLMAERINEKHTFFFLALDKTMFPNTHFFSCF